MQNGKTAAKPCSHPTYPQFKEEFGEDPARILYHMSNPAPRIRGITNIDLLRAYQTVEAEKENPSRRLIAKINSRILSLQELDAANNPSETQRAVATDGGVTQ